MNCGDDPIRRPTRTLRDSAALHRQVDALNQRARPLRHQDARQALQLCRQAQAMAPQADYQRGLAWSLLRLGG